MESLNWYLIAAACSATMLLAALWRNRQNQRRQQMTSVAIIKRRRKLKKRLKKLLDNDELKATRAAQSEGARLNVSSTSLEALEAVIQSAETYREQLRRKHPASICAAPSETQGK